MESGVTPRTAGSLVEFGTITLNPQEPIRTRYWFAVGSEEEILHADFTGRIVRVFDSDGSVRLTLGRHGRGTGAYRIPSWVTQLGESGQYLVVDYGGRKLLYFDHAGAFQREVLLPNIYVRTAWPVDGRLLLAGRDPATAKLLHLLGQTGTVTSFYDSSTHLARYSYTYGSGVFASRAENGRLYCFQRTDHAFEIYSSEGSLLSRVRLVSEPGMIAPPTEFKPQLLSIDPNYRRNWTDSWAHVRFAQLLEDEILVSVKLASGFHEKRYLIQIYDLKGAYQGSVYTDKRLIAIDAKGTLYLSQTDLLPDELPVEGSPWKISKAKLIRSRRPVTKEASR